MAKIEVGKVEEISFEEEEALEELWMMLVESEKNKVERKNINEGVKIHDIDINKTITALAEKGLISVDDDRISLTSRGYEKAQNVIRRHRLAERLLHDLLEMKNTALEIESCKFEHVISEDVEESLCTLLGHPKVCPHGAPIPPGKCCIEARKEIESVVKPLFDLNPGDEGTIAYVLTKKHSRLDKLLSFGILPGTKIKVHQKFPSFVVKTDETLIAFEEDISKDIYVRKAS